MLDLPQLWNIASRVPGLVSGAAIHHAALRAMQRGDHAGAALLFERAAERYRSDLEPERLARLRVHQMIAAVRSGRCDDEAGTCREVERLLARLDRIESLDPPFDLVSAHSMLASWYTSSTGATGTDRLARAA